MQNPAELVASMLSNELPVPFAVATKQALLTAVIELLRIASLAKLKLGAEEDIDLEPLMDLIDEGKTELVKLLSNLVYRNAELQSLAGSMGAIDLCTSNCQLDAQMPMVREWAILAVRNLLENHVANQALVSSLQVETVANNAELSTLGLEAALDQRTGKVTLRAKAKETL